MLRLIMMDTTGDPPPVEDQDIPRKGRVHAARTPLSSNSQPRCTIARGPEGVGKQGKGKEGK